MNNYERLLDDADKSGIIVTEKFDLSDTRFKGLLCDNVIAIDRTLDTDIDKATILAEELGHYHTTYGNIIDMNDVSNRKQELRARSWAYDKLVGLNGIIESYKHGCSSLHETAEYLEVTEEFLSESIESYRRRYGCYTRIDNYIIYFQPTLGVLEMI